MTGLNASLGGRLDAMHLARPVELSGRVTRHDGHLLACDGFPVSVGAVCAIETDTGTPALAEIIGFDGGQNLMSLYDINARVRLGARVTLRDEGRDIQVGPEVLGRVVDALGRPLDNRPMPPMADRWPLSGKEINPLARDPVAIPLDVGVRVINSCLTVGRGQRLGIIAGSGVGKSVLLSMMSRFTEADIVVVGLIGERGREVGNFVDMVMTPDARAKTVIVAVPADRSPLLRIRGAERATSIAEYFRDQGKNVLLIMDSLTRVAHARREIGLALGEQPTSKGYPPSVISMIPRLVERSGTGVSGAGSITSFYTVLADGDDTNDPVVDAARAILDGHIVLSREQAQLGIYPAVDLPASISRVAADISSDAHTAAVRQFRRLVSLYLENRDLVMMGGYVQGQDADLDVALQMWPQLVDHIMQPATQKADFDSSRNALLALLGGN
ncbi:MAG: flagellum-specific ATP synthase FliI [Rhizobiales bacterium TMED29]|nr:MAG: flagellum-specific ATP synthase FliI [Rhizobiales bacterium TMED29]